MATESYHDGSMVGSKSIKSRTRTQEHYHALVNIHSRLNLFRDGLHDDMSRLIGPEPSTNGKDAPREGSLGSLGEIEDVLHDIRETIEDLENMKPFFSEL